MDLREGLTDKFWNALLGVLRRTDLNDDARFSSPAARANNRAALTAALDEEFRRQPTKFWMSALAGVLPIAPVFDLEQALESPFLRTNGMIAHVPHPSPECAVLSQQVKINGSASAAGCSPMGADTQEAARDAAATARSLGCSASRFRSCNGGGSVTSGIRPGKERFARLPALSTLPVAGHLKTYREDPQRLMHRRCHPLVPRNPATGAGTPTRGFIHQHDRSGTRAPTTSAGLRPRGAIRQLSG